MIRATVSRERAAKDKEDMCTILTFTKLDWSAVRELAKNQGTLEILESLFK
jgi:hypothetical protein